MENYRESNYPPLLNLTLMGSWEGVLGLGDAILTGGGGGGGALTAAAAASPCGHHNKGI